MVERLSRLTWIYERSPIYFVTFNTHRRQKLLADHEVHGTLQAFAEKGSALGAWLGAYVLMPDHMHAFVAFGREEKQSRVSEISNWVRSAKIAMSRAIRGAGIAMPHWQKGFFDHVLRGSESYEGKWHYVLQNPVRAGLVTDPADWPFRGQPWPLEYRRDC